MCRVLNLYRDTFENFYVYFLVSSLCIYYCMEINFLLVFIITIIIYLFNCVKKKKILTLFKRVKLILRKYSIYLAFNLTPTCQTL